MPWDKATEWDFYLFGWHVFQVIVYAIVGLAAFGIAYLIIDKATPFSLRKELIDDKNVSIAIVLASVFLGISIIVAAAIRG